METLRIHIVLLSTEDRKEVGQPQNYSLNIDNIQTQSRVKFQFKTYRLNPDDIQSRPPLNYILYLWLFQSITKLFYFVFKREKEEKKKWECFYNASQSIWFFLKKYSSFHTFKKFIPTYIPVINLPSIQCLYKCCPEQGPIYSKMCVSFIIKNIFYQQ